MPLSRDSRRRLGFLVFVHGHGDGRDADGGAPPRPRGSWLAAIEASLAEQVAESADGVPELMKPSLAATSNWHAAVSFCHPIWKLNPALASHQFACEMFL
ncbi:hypothetical protein SETIT_2G394700v2 [Setaria italica]|uniref:Uncharacterized protein n=1 Tax=Setaria italica TaxID=4555 RepID=A0A368Q7R6_SETIT|nr:hypothetical protein SETIT_2G394700v2 [Setaria italica]